MGFFMNKEIINGEIQPEHAIGPRIRQIRKSLKMTQKVFAESLGIVQGFLSAIEKGKKTPSDTLLIALQHLYKVSPEWIYSGKGNIMTSGVLRAFNQSEDFATIPLLTELPITINDFRATTHFERYISLPGAPKNCFAFEYTGDYMQPTIRDGDIIIVNPDKPLTSGNIALIVGKWKEPLLRRYREINNDRYFSPDNSTYAPFKSDDSIQILGVVVKIWREIKI